jgi:ion channel
MFRKTFSSVENLMTLTMQILLGSFVLGICSLIHIAILVWSVSLIKILNPILERFSIKLRLTVLLGKSLGFVIVSHSVQVWIWAFSFVLSGTIPNLGDAVYFALATYTTLGYGDIILGEGFRVYGAMAAVTGLLSFGLSTAFLAGLLSRLILWQK